MTKQMIKAAGIIGLVILLLGMVGVMDALAEGKTLAAYDGIIITELNFELGYIGIIVDSATYGHATIVVTSLDSDGNIVNISSSDFYTDRMANGMWALGRECLLYALTDTIIVTVYHDARIYLNDVPHILVNHTIMVDMTESFSGSSYYVEAGIWARSTNPSVIY